MSFCNCNSHRTELQKLLDERNTLSNDNLMKSKVKAIDDTIKSLRSNNPPSCWGEDDCSTYFLIHCPWSIDCGK